MCFSLPPVHGVITDTHFQQDGDILLQLLDGPNIIAHSNFLKNYSSDEVVGQRFVLTYCGDSPSELALPDLGIVLRLVGYVHPKEEVYVGIES